ncbi:NAD(P)-dependent oxidoreductase [Roseospira marina]|uniref:NAD(P)-dependent oxidoreductase n=1 Tax=Roseospira marina TaxID=140057 RepID=A0A5M6IFH5_9PROT|nr:NAD(P)-dependent oxidoreductase [Roseospira marina]KAA5607031.1 NAD(P)-dependent oxidoreductase [Roseospira marina]MBB4312783.1 glutamate synthase (NADPH/NADH) small chain [Roseospira marina]MBB5086444.1 glutamate synthase (NADPH/NADH) small chain [Roseospira marina]
MGRKMMQFTRLTGTMPDKRDADDRRQDFEEIYSGFAPDRASDQASRCEQCGIPYCQVHCPLQNNIPDWLLLTAQGRLEEAYAVSSATNNMPEICGRICPQDRLCEGSCVLEQSKHGTVTIGAVEKYITDTAWDNGWVQPVQPNRERPQSIGIIGAGPGGMAAAEQLRKYGYQVTLYDRHDRAGGLLIYGIPGFKLEKHIVERRAALLAEAGVKIKLNFEVGRDATLAEIRDRHDAVLIATGVYKARALTVPGAGLPGVLPALSYLTASNRLGLGDAVPEFDSGELDAKGKNVVVIGGGDTAMDCLRTAIRQGAASVKCLYRRDRANMPGSQREVSNAIEEGVEFVWLSAPEAVLDANGSASEVQAVRMHLGIADATGRQTPTPIEGSQFRMPAEMVISALGFEPEDLPTLFGAPDLPVTRWGTLTVDPHTMMTSAEGVFAAGDIVRGASLVVWAVRDGRDAAVGIHDYIQAKAGGAGDAVSGGSGMALAS